MTNSLESLTEHYRDIFSETILYNPTGRRTHAHIRRKTWYGVCKVTGEKRALREEKEYFSYRIMIAKHVFDIRFERNEDGYKYKTQRLPNKWGPTTGRHFNELGCASFPIVKKITLGD